MASFAEILEIIIHADSGQAVSSLTKTAGASDALGVKTSRLGKLGLSSGVMYAAGAALVVGGLYEAAKAADAEQISLLKLQNSMKNNPLLAKASEKAFLDLADALHQITVVDDNVVVETEAMLGSFKMTQDQILDLTPLVVDYARKYDVDVVQAAKAVGKATEGQIGTLRRNGVMVDEVRAKTDGYGAVVDALRTKVGGFAAEEGKTFSGQMQILKNNLMDVVETIGSAVIPVFTTLASSVVKALDVAKDLGLGYIGAGAAIGAAFGPLGAVVGGALGGIGHALEATEEDMKKNAIVAKNSRLDFLAYQTTLDATTGAVKQDGDAHQRTAQQIQITTDAVWRKIDADLALQGSTLGSQRAVETYTKTLFDGKATALDRAEAELRVKQAFMQQAKAAGEDAVQALGKHATATETAKARNKAMVDSLSGLASTLAPGSPLRVYLDQTITKLNNQLAGTKTVTLVVADNLFNSKINAAMAKIQGLGAGKLAAIPKRAAGGSASGLTWVGERGPELVSLPSGSYVHNNSASMAMAGGGGTVVNNSITINAGANADPAEIGRVTVDAIRAFERRSGKAWRN